MDERCFLCMDTARYSVIFTCILNHDTYAGYCGEHISQKKPLSYGCLICGAKLLWVTSPELPGFLSFRSYDGTVFWIVPERWTQEERLRT